MEIVINNQTLLVEEYLEEVTLLDAEIALLKDKSLLEQSKLFCIHYENYLTESEYGDEFTSKVLDIDKDLENVKDLQKILVKNGIIVGVQVEIYGRVQVLILNKNVCAYSCCDEDGVGRRDVEDYAMLILKGQN